MRVLALLMLQLCLGSAALAAPTCPPGQFLLNGTCIDLRGGAGGGGGEADTLIEHEHFDASVLSKAGSPTARHLHRAPAVPSAPASAAPRDGVALVPVRAYLKAADIPPPAIGAYGIVALRALPTSASRERLAMLCDSFVHTLAKQADLDRNVTPERQMLTIWPLKHPEADGARQDRCDSILQDYDLTAADAAISDASRQKASFTGQGPYLIGWSPSDTRGVPDKLVLVVDLSHCNSQKEFDNQLLFWKEQVVERPELWRRGFWLDGLRQALRDFAERHGQDMLDAIKIIGLK